MPNCLCGKKGTYIVEHGALCELCYIRHMDEKFHRFVSKNKLIVPGPKYVFIYDSYASEVEIYFLERFFEKYGLGSLVLEKKLSSFETDKLVSKYSGCRIILPNTIDLDSILGLKGLVESTKFNPLPKYKIKTVEFTKPFNNLKNDELEQYSKIKGFKFKRNTYGGLEPYTSNLDKLDKKYFIRRSFLNSLINLYKPE